MLKRPGQFCYELKNGTPQLTKADDALIFAFIPPSEEDKAWLTGELLLDEHTVLSSLDPDEMARLEFEASHVAVILKRPDTLLDLDEDGDFGVDSAGAFLFPDKLIVIQADDDPLFEYPLPERCETPAGALLALFFESIWQFMHNLKVIRQLSDSIQDNIAYSLDNHALSFMFTLQKSLMYYESALQSNRAVLLELRTNSGQIGFSAEELRLLDDLIVENDQCEGLVDIYSRVLTGLSDARVSIVNNNLTVLIKKLTIISLVFLPLNLIASIGGMSEWTWMTEAVPWQVAYGSLLVGLALLGLITWRLIGKIGIEERPKKPGHLRRLFCRHDPDDPDVCKR